MNSYCKCQIPSNGQMDTLDKWTQQTQRICHRHVHRVCPLCSLDGVWHKRFFLPLVWCSTAKWSWLRLERTTSHRRTTPWSLPSSASISIDVATYLPSMRASTMTQQSNMVLLFCNNNKNNSNNNNNNNHNHGNNRRYLESLGCWACPGNWQTGHTNHWRTPRIHLSISAVVDSPPKEKCGRLP